jgi:hypothetical protein
MAHDPNCLFCKIIDGKIPSRKVYEDDQVFAFHDIHPWAPVHFLIIPKLHIPSFAQLGPEHAGLMGHMMTLAPPGAAGGLPALSGRWLPGRQQHRRRRGPRKSTTCMCM